MRIVFAGDWHATPEAAWAAIEHAKGIGADAIVHVGDFHFTGESRGRFMKSVNKALARYDVPLYFIRGNHDNPDYLDAQEAKRGTVDGTPFIAFSERLFYIPDGSVWEWDGVKIGGLGGAFSVDHKFRTQGVDWWANEVTKPEAVEAIAQTPDLGLLVTHDVPDTVFVSDLPVPTKDMDIEGAHPNRQAIARAIEGSAPAWHICGHMHVRQTHFIRNATTGSETRSVILDRGDYAGEMRNQQRLAASLLALDFVDGEILPVF